MKTMKTISAFMLIALMATMLPFETDVSLAKKKTPPSKVYGLRLVKAGRSSITVKWRRARRARKYIVYRSGGSGERFVKRAVTSRSGFTDYRVKPGAVYRYYVRGYNGRLGRPSSILKVRTRSSRYVVKSWKIGGNGTNKYDYKKQAWSTVKAVLYSDGLFEIRGKGNTARFTAGTPWYREKNPETGKKYNRHIVRVYISKSVKPTNMSSMFKGCINLMKAPEIPETVKRFDECFSGCSSLRKVATIKKGNAIESAEGMYRGCRNLRGEMWILGAVRQTANMRQFFAGAATAKGAGLKLRCRIGENEDITGVGATIDKMLDSKSQTSKITEKPYFVKQSPVIKSWKIGGDGETPYNLKTQGASNVTASLHEDGLLKIEGKGNMASFVGDSSCSPWRISKINGTYCYKLIRYVYVDRNVEATNISRLFDLCKNLHKINRIPRTTKEMEWTFCFCSKIYTSPPIPKGIKYMESAFFGSGLKTPPVLPEGVKDLGGTFSICDNLIQASAIPKSAEYVNAMFSGCSNLRRAADIPRVNNIKNAVHMYSGCENLTGEMYVNGAIAGSVGFFFKATSTEPGARLKVMYSSSASDAVKATVDRMIAEKSPESNIVKEEY